MIKKLTTWREWAECDRILGTAFLDGYDEAEAAERRRAQFEKGEPSFEEAWGFQEDDGAITSAVTTIRRRMTFDGHIIPVVEAHMVGTLPEAKGRGNARNLLRQVLREFRERGDLFAILIPFSFQVYRKFGFELVSRDFEYRAGIDQFAPFERGMEVRQVRSQADVDAARRLYDGFSRKRNFAEARGGAEWLCRGSGEFGARDWFHRDKQKYTYIFSDGEGRDRGYFTFIYLTPDNPFVGKMVVTELVYDSPEALRSIFAFIYSFRGKVKDVEISCMDLDLAILLPEPDSLDKKMAGHWMARALDIPGILARLRHPGRAGAYTIHVEDDFLPENTGTWRVSWEDAEENDRTGEIGFAKVEVIDEPADLSVDVRTFAQLAAGRIDLDEAVFRAGTEARGNAGILRHVFRHRPVSLR